MEITVEHLGAGQFEIKTRGHSIVSDQRAKSGGVDEGMAPPELLPASLGSCAGYYAAQCMRKMKLATEGTRIRVTCEKVEDPLARMTNFVIQIDSPVELTKTHRKGIEEAVAHCLEHTLKVEAPVPAQK